VNCDGIYQLWRQTGDCGPSSLRSGEEETQFAAYTRRNGGSSRGTVRAPLALRGKRTIAHFASPSDTTVGNIAAQLRRQLVIAMVDAPAATRADDRLFHGRSTNRPRPVVRRTTGVLDTVLIERRISGHEPTSNQQTRRDPIDAEDTRTAAPREMSVEQLLYLGTRQEAIRSLACWMTNGSSCSTAPTAVTLWRSTSSRQQLK
jgi:hypothetical protein